MRFKTEPFSPKACIQENPEPCLGMEWCLTQKCVWDFIARVYVVDFQGRLGKSWPFKGWNTASRDQTDDLGVKYIFYIYISDLPTWK